MQAFLLRTPYKTQQVSEAVLDVLLGVDGIPNATHKDIPGHDIYGLVV